MTTISSYPSPSLTSFTMAATFILVSQVEGLRNERVVEEEEQEQEHLGDHHLHLALLLLLHLLHHGRHLPSCVPG